MFPNNGPVAAMNSLRTFIALQGINAFPAVAQQAFSDLLTADVFTSITVGSERLYAGITELPDFPDKPAALQVLGELSQQYGLNNLNQNAQRGFELMTWTVGQVVEGGGDVPDPDVNPTYTFEEAPPPIDPPVPPV